MLRILARIFKSMFLRVFSIMFHAQLDSQCYAQADSPQQCRPPADDYLECLHRKKEVSECRLGPRSKPRLRSLIDSPGNEDQGCIR